MMVLIVILPIGPRIQIILNGCVKPVHVAVSVLVCWLLLAAACGSGPGDTHPGPAFITGIVFEDGNGDGVQGENEGGIGGIVIRAEEAGSAGGGFSDATTTDGNGYYSMELPGSLYELFVDPESLPVGYRLTSEPAMYELTLPDGREESQLNFGYQRR